MYTLLLEVEDVQSSLSSKDSEEDSYNMQHKKQELCEQLFLLMNLSEVAEVYVSVYNGWSVRQCIHVHLHSLSMILVQYYMCIPFNPLKYNSLA